jgi:Amt family ammonium transporter
MAYYGLDFREKTEISRTAYSSIAGLATITPAAGYVSVPFAVIIGIISGIICYGAIGLKNKMGWDDALDVWGVHGVGGTIGVIMLGLFASTAVNTAGANGLLFGGGGFFVKQLLSVTGASVYALAFSYIALIIIDKIIPVRTTEEEEEAGLMLPFTERKPTFKADK